MENNSDGYIKTQFDGKKALIKGDHPHSGETAQCLGADITNAGPGLIFKPDYEDTFFVFKPENVEWVK